MHQQATGRTSTVFVYAAAAFLVLPLIAVVPFSFTSKRYLSYPDGQWSLRHYQALANSPEWVSSFWTSFSIGIFTAALSTVLACLFCLGIWYRRPRFGRLLIGFVLMPMAVPPIISALVLYFFETGTGLYDTPAGVVVAHTIMAVPYAVVSIFVALSLVDRRLELASSNLGATIWQTTFWVILPNIRFGIISAAFISFMVSWEELSVTLFVTSVQVVTLPRRIWSGLRDNVDPVIAAISVVLVLATIVLMATKLILDSRAERLRAT